MMQDKDQPAELDAQTVKTLLDKLEGDDDEVASQARDDLGEREVVEEVHGEGASVPNCATASMGRMA